MVETGPASITVRTHVAGLHYWLGAPMNRSYLAHPHRHQFGLTVTVGVGHDDREVEFHDLVALAREHFVACGHLRGELVDFGAASCEMLARTVAVSLAERLRREVHVSVSEDEEFVSTVYAVLDPQDSEEAETRASALSTNPLEDA